MKPLHELLKGKVVNCQTEEEAKELMEFLDKNGYFWNISGRRLTIGTNNWYSYKKKTCYIIYESSVCYGNKNEFKGKKIYTYEQFKQLINENNMETKEVKIQVPEGYEIDKENSTFDCIKFKPIKKVLTYDDVAEELFCHNSHYYEHEGNIYKCSSCLEYASKQNIRCTSAKQAEKLIAINKLMNVAKYLNGEWRPNWDKGCDTELKYFITKTNIDELTICHVQWTNDINIFFKSYKLAQQAIEILGEGTIKLALSTDW